MGVIEFLDTSGEIRLRGTLTGLASFNGGTITNALAIAPTGDGGVALTVKPAVSDNNNTFGLLLDATNGGVQIKLTANGDPEGTALFSVGSAGDIAGGTITGTELVIASRIVTQDGNKLGFFGTFPTTKPTGVAVTAAAIHAALVSLGLIAA